MKNIKRCFTPLLAVALFATATVAHAKVHRVFPGESIQAAIDKASPGDTIMVEPGVYNEDPTSRYGLRIKTDNLRLIGKVKKGQGDAGKVIITPKNPQVGDFLNDGLEQTGVYAAPEGCSPEADVGDEFCEDNRINGFYIRGFTVKGYEWNGIQTRFVNDFKIIRNEAGNLGRNGIYPTISANGLVQNNVAYGTLDTSMWVAAWVSIHWTRWRNRVVTTLTPPIPAPARGLGRLGVGEVHQTDEDEHLTQLGREREESAVF